MWLIKNGTARWLWGGGTNERCYKYFRTVCTSTIYHLNTPEVRKYSKSYKIYLQYFICMRLTKHEITSVHSRKDFWNSLERDRHHISKQWWFRITMHHNEWFPYFIGFWILITIWQEISHWNTRDVLPYYTHRTDTEDPQYIHNDVPSDYGCQRILYYSYHSQIDASQYIIMM